MDKRSGDALMPRAPKPCGQSGCETRVIGRTYCDEHANHWPNHSSTRAVPYVLQQACFRRDRNTCQRCGYIGTPGTGDLHADHKINRACGGADTLDNLETLCVPCHDIKTRRERVPLHPLPGGL